MCTFENYATPVAKVLDSLTCFCDFPARNEQQAWQGCEDDYRDPLTGVNGLPRHTLG